MLLQLIINIYIKETFLHKYLNYRVTYLFILLLVLLHEGKRKITD